MIHHSGFDGIELHVDLNPWPIPPHAEDEELLQLLNVIHTAGLKVTGFSTMVHMNYPITAKDITKRTLAMETIDRMLTAVKLMGGKSVSIAPGGMEDNWESALPVIKDLNEKAKRIGIPLMLENVWYSFSKDMCELERLVHAINDPNLGVCFDIGNVLPYGNIEEWLLRLDGKIGKIHISDSMIGDPPQICPVGEGQADWERIGKVVNSMNYDGDITLEIFPRQGVSLPLELMRTSRYLKKCFNLGGK